MTGKGAGLPRGPRGQPSGLGGFSKLVTSPSESDAEPGAPGPGRRHHPGLEAGHKLRTPLALAGSSWKARRRGVCGT